MVENGFISPVTSPKSTSAPSSSGLNAVETLLKFNVIYLAKEEGEFVITSHVMKKIYLIK